MKIVKGNDEMIQYLNRAELRGEYVAYFTEDDQWEGVQVVPPKSFGSITVRPSEAAVYLNEPYDPNVFIVNDTSFECDYNENTEFVVYEKEDVIHMIKILMKCL